MDRQWIRLLNDRIIVVFRQITLGAIAQIIKHEQIKMLILFPKLDEPLGSGPVVTTSRLGEQMHKIKVFILQKIQPSSDGTHCFILTPPCIDEEWYKINKFAYCIVV
ncbi:hypothetical protein D3C76_992420 [compost metagenome]